MLNLKDGTPLGLIEHGKHAGEIIYIDRSDIDEDDYNGCQEINLRKNTLQPLMNTDEREVSYIAGPSGSGKTTYAVDLAKSYNKIFPKRPIYVFSRTDIKDDPAFKKLPQAKQVELDESIITEPIDITELEKGSLVIFDDTNTIGDKKIRDATNFLICDILETGRKMGLWIILTSHLINQSEKKMNRTIMNEMQSFTFFPKSGSSYQIKYALKQYFGLNKKQIDRILGLKSRWVTVLKNYPMTVVYKHGVYILD